MENEKPAPSRSRRRFLSSGASALAGGLVGGAVYASAPGATAPSPGSSPALPWQWQQIDPMEAGSRAYRYYHEVGG
jgi:hypothetical protein